VARFLVSMNVWVTTLRGPNPSPEQVEESLIGLLRSDTMLASISRPDGTFEASTFAVDAAEAEATGDPMSRPDSCPNCGSRSIRARTGSYCQDCGESLTTLTSLAPRELPPHGPGCKPLAGLKSSRFPGDLRYVCAANCPRRRALAQLDRSLNETSAPGRRTALEQAEHDGDGERCEECGLFIPCGEGGDRYHTETCSIGIALVKSENRRR